MEDGALKVFIGLAVAIVGLATLSVVLSQNAQTTSVINAASSGLGTVITDAVAPVSSTNTGLGIL
jgi:PRD1 phage membrane DNA delivery